MKTLKNLMIGLLLAMTGTALSSGAYASNMHFMQYKKRAVTVKYSDLNLADRAGVKTLYKRLRRAGHEACGPKYGIDPIMPGFDWMSWNACYKKALDNAAAKIGNEQLSQMVDNRTDGMTTALAYRG